MQPTAAWSCACITSWRSVERDAELGARLGGQPHGAVVEPGRPRGRLRAGAEGIDRQVDDDRQLGAPLGAGELSDLLEEAGHEVREGQRPQRGVARPEGGRARRPRDRDALRGEDSEPAGGGTVASSVHGSIRCCGSAGTSAGARTGAIVGAAGSAPGPCHRGSAPDGGCGRPLAADSEDAAGAGRAGAAGPARPDSPGARRPQPPATARARPRARGAAASRPATIQPREAPGTPERSTARARRRMRHRGRGDQSLVTS